jgi:hypothetical protein
MLDPEGPSKAGEGVGLWVNDGPPPSVPPLKGEGGAGAEAAMGAKSPLTFVIVTPYRADYSLRAGDLRVWARQSLR